MTLTAMIYFLQIFFSFFLPIHITLMNRLEILPLLKYLYFTPLHPLLPITPLQGNLYIRGVIMSIT